MPDPHDWSFDAVLKDGGVVRVRPIEPTDGDALQDMVRHMGREALYNRFFRVKVELTEEEIEHFTKVDYESRMAFVAELDGEVVAVARYDAIDDDPSVAEVAFAVRDAHQGRGITTRLLQHLTAYARQTHIERFKAFVLAENYAMIRVFRNSGFVLTRDLDEGVYTVEFPTEESDESRAVQERNERQAVAASILPFFYPKSVAVIGASRDPRSIGGRLFANLVNGDFAGPVFPVNPSASVVRSVKAYPTVSDIPDDVDLAFLVVPASHVLQAATECAAKGVRSLVVISAGFSETGTEGAAMEEELLALTRSAGMRMIGPNCMGILNTDPAVSLDGQFGPIFPARGNVAMSSQSGALGLAILDYADRLNIGISSFVSVGNKADVSGNDLLLYWEEDPATDVILLYLESFGSPRRFARIAQRIGKTKPIVAVKSGRTQAGARAASSHTGSLASADVAVEALFRQAGVIRTNTLAELFDVTALLSNQPLPEGRRVGVITNAGGPAILAVDALAANGLDVVEFSDELQATLRTHLSAAAAVQNPVDMIASADPAQYAACIEVLCETDEIDALIVIYIPTSDEGMDDIAAAIQASGSVASAANKVVMTVFMRAAGVPSHSLGQEVSIPSFQFPESAARALAAAADYADWRNRPHGSVPVFDMDLDAAHAVIARALASSDDVWLDPDEASAVLRSAGLRIPQSLVVQTVEDAIEAAAEMGGPVVLKVVSDSALHKSDVGGIALDVRGEEAIRAAFATVTSAVDDADGVLIQEFVSGGHEVIIGMTEDPTFGPLIAFGLGGVFVELVGDVAFRIHPLTDVDAREMIGGVKAARLLEGYRGGDQGDIAGVQDALLRVSALVDGLPEIVEMDLNPVKVKQPGEGISVVDARIRVRKVSGPWVPSRRDVAGEA